MSLPPPALPLSFTNRKTLILSALSVPAEQYDDLSPKGSIDEGIRGLIEGMNASEGWVTTSSCAGRVSVFVEGKRMLKRKTTGGEGQWKRERVVESKGEGGKAGDGGGEEDTYGEGNENEVEVEAEGDGDEDRGNAEKATKMKLAGVGGKGGGGRWLFVSHEPVDIDEVKEEDFSSFLGMNRMGDVMDAGRQFTEERLIHFKFEPMILHVLTASLSHAQSVLKAALQAGFRESGALNLISAANEPPTPMVAVRSTGLALDSVIGRLDVDGDGVCIVPDTYLKGLLAVANERFEENSKRITRFCDLLLGSVETPPDMEARKKSKAVDWEDASVRRERKRAEGLKRSQELMQQMNGANI